MPLQRPQRGRMDASVGRDVSHRGFLKGAPGHTVGCCCGLAVLLGAAVDVVCEGCAVVVQSVAAGDGRVLIVRDATRATMRRLR